MDYQNNDDFEDYNTIIYGHNMKNYTMFGTLVKYKEQEYYNKHSGIFLLIERQKYKIELFAGYITSSQSSIYNFPKNSKTNQEFIKTAIKNSTLKSNVNVTNEDKIITFSTCSYDFENARYILLAVLRQLN